MSARWRVIDLTQHDGQISTASGRIVVDSTQVPLDDVTCILTGPSTRWSGALVALAAKFEIPILSCDWRGIPHAVMMPWASNSRVAARFHAQCDMTEPRKKNAWMRIVQAKVKGQAANLVGLDRQRLLDLVPQVRSGDPANIEARAARSYWSRLFPGEGFRRDFDLDGRNACLNYGYAVLRGCVIRAICAAGLHPALGMYHRNRSNAFGLADDLVEPFRPAVDYAVRQLPAAATPSDAGIKAALVATISLPMRQEGVSVASSVNDLAQRFAIYAEGGSPRLTVPTWSPPDG